MRKIHINNILLLFLIFSCSPKIVQFINDEAHFEKYSTFAPVNSKINIQDISEEGKVLITSLENSINLQMTKRDYLLNITPDLFVRYELITNEKTTTNQSNSPYRSNYIYSGSLYSWNYPSKTVREATLLLEIIDSKSTKTIWQASVELNQYSESRKPEEILHDAVNTLFDSYLYRARSANADPTLKSSK